MITLHHDVPSIDLDENDNIFISTFMSHVSAVVGYGENRLVTIARVKLLLLAAIADGNDPHRDAWTRLHRSVAEIVAAARRTPASRRAHGYLRAFVRENGDLTDD